MPRALSFLRSIALALAPALLGAFPARAEWVDWIAEAQVLFEYNDNLNLSPFGGDELDDVSWHPRASIGRVFQAGERTRLSLTAEVEGDIYARYDRLDAVEGGGQLAVFHKFGLGDAPWARLALFGGYLDVADGERSGYRVEPSVTLGKRFSPRFDAFLEYRFTHRDGGNGVPVVMGIGTNVFDQQFHRISVGGNFLVLPRLLLGMGYTFRTGEFDSACSAANVGMVLARANVRAIQLDGLGANQGVFGGCVYRLSGDGHAASVKLNYAVTDRIALDVGYRFQHGESGMLDYESNVARMMVLFRY